MPYLPDRELFVDLSFFNNNISNLQKLAEQNVRIDSKAHSKYNGIKQINQHITSREATDYGKKIYIGRMGLVGFFALSLAIKEGYKEIFLLGYDGGTSKAGDTKTHCYQGEINVISSGVGNPNVYRKPNGELKDELKDFEIYLQEKDVQIWNVSMESNINCFPKIGSTEFFERIENAR